MKTKIKIFAGGREEHWPSECDLGGRRRHGGHLIACVAGGFALVFSPDNCNLSHKLDTIMGAAALEVCLSNLTSLHFH